eukprot:COSAG01_NODE_35871_length_525_cov_1.490610_1_plen_79_part_01
MLPYFPTMTSMLDSGRRRAQMNWSQPWSKYPGYEHNSSSYVSQGHPAYGRWMTDIEHVEFGAGALEPGRIPASMGGYKG